MNGGVFHGFHYYLLQINLDVSLIHVDDDVVLGIQAVFLLHHHSEDVLDDAYEDIFIDSLFTNHLSK